MSTQQADTRFLRKRTLSYATIASFGVVALLVGLILIIVVNYHERAYVFLGLGTGCFIGGIAGIVGARANFKTVLSYGMIAFGMMGAVIGLNYLYARYGPAPNVGHAILVLSISVVALLVGILGAWMVRTKGSLVTLLSVLTLGIIASMGIVAMNVGIIYNFELDSPKHGSILLSVGIVCLIAGVVGGRISQGRMKERW